MTFPVSARSAFLALLAFSLLSLAGCSKTAEPFEFLVTSSDVAMGASAVDVRLKKSADGAFIDDAVISATRLDMTPEGMHDMTSDVTAQGAVAPGVYRFLGDFKMAGRWQLNLMAQVPGQIHPVRGSVILIVK